MTEMFRCRVPKELLEEADLVAREIGTTPGDVVRLLFTQLVKRRSIPFPLNADRPEDEAFLRTAGERRNLWDKL